MIYFKRWMVFFILPFFTSCAAVAVTGAGAGANYTLTNVAYRTFNCSLARANKATTQALKRLGIKIVDNSKTEKGRKIKGSTKELEILIDLERVTAKATKIKVNAKKGRFLKDKATAAEIIHQIDKILEGKG
jgi:hypothetical protein